MGVVCFDVVDVGDVVEKMVVVVDYLFVEVEGVD